MRLMKHPFFALMVAGAIALGSPNAVLAAGRTGAGGGHAVERVAACRTRLYPRSYEAPRLLRRTRLWVRV